MIYLGSFHFFKEKGRRSVWGPGREEEWQAKGFGGEEGEGTSQECKTNTSIKEQRALRFYLYSRSPLLQVSAVSISLLYPSHACVDIVKHKNKCTHLFLFLTLTFSCKGIASAVATGCFVSISKLKVKAVPMGAYKRVKIQCNVDFIYLNSVQMHTLSLRVLQWHVGTAIIPSKHRKDSGEGVAVAPAWSLMCPLGHLHLQAKTNADERLVTTLSVSPYNFTRYSYYVVLMSSECC